MLLFTADPHACSTCYKDMQLGGGHHYFIPYLCFARLRCAAGSAVLFTVVPAAFLFFWFFLALLLGGLTSFCLRLCAAIEIVHHNFLSRLLEGGVVVLQYVFGACSTPPLCQPVFMVPQKCKSRKYQSICHLFPAKVLVIALASRQYQGCAYHRYFFILVLGLPCPGWGGGVLVCGHPQFPRFLA